MKASDIEWCQNLFRSIAEGGTWGVPRSGLIFIKRDGKLVLSARLPVVLDMPFTDEDLLVYQQEDFQIIKEHFEAAGIPVEDRYETDSAR